MASNTQPSTKNGSQVTVVDAGSDRWDGATETSPLVSDRIARRAAAGDGGSGEIRQDTWLGYVYFADLSWWRKPSVYWLLPPYCLFTLAFGGIIVPKLNLILDLVCRNYFAECQLLDPNFTFDPVIMGAENRQCNIPPVHKIVAAFTLIMSALTGALSALTAPRLGALSDRYGRKRLMVISSCGGLVSEVITILAAKFPDTVDYRWLILGCFFDGVTGSFTAGTVLANSYTSDCTPPSKRGVHIAYLHSCLFIGLAFGPLLAGYFVEWTGTLVTLFYVVLGCHTVVILWFRFVLPESMPAGRQAAARAKHRAQREAAGSLLLDDDPAARWLPALLRANPLAPLRILVPRGRANGALRRNLVVLALIDTLFLSAAIGAGTVVVLYSEYTFGWDTAQASRFVSVVSMLRVVILLVLLPAVNYVVRVRPQRRRERLGGSAAPVIVEKNAGSDALDVWMLRLALAMDAAGTAGYVFVRREGLFVACGLATAFGGLASATTQSALTKHVPAERVGALLGAIGLLHSLGRVVAPALFNGIYAATIESFPQAFFVVLASLFGLAVLGSFFVRPHVHIGDDDDAGAGYDRVPALSTPDDDETARARDILADEEIPGETLPRL
ncbi:MFS general substrate transporter [Durotheca rogersii]|uniref:MFS general substrate transporter n=1 Tax=Durotheca rogersii TaxID=419775 RepID=UPI00221FAD80|nr:MFS general substrate transporter [Durotheca rogersii]KAI5867022.1 MFS general substrate transporter [Durotheca rogersii]